MGSPADSLDAPRPSAVEAPSGGRISPLLLTMFLTGGLLSATYGVMFTVLDDYRSKLRVGESAIGLIVSTGFFIGFLAQVTLAPLADRGHARSLLVGGLALTILGTLGMGFGQSLVAVLLARVAAGFGAGMAVPALRRVIILAQPEKVGSNMGRILAADVAGFAAGPVISALTVNPFGLAAPFIITAAALAVCAVIVSRARIVEAEVDETTSGKMAFDLLRIRPLAGAIVIGLAVFVMIGTFDALWSVVMEDIGAREWIATVGISIFALPLVFLGPLGGRLAQRRGPLRIATYGLVAGAGFMACYGLLPEAAAMLAVGVVHGVNDGLTVTGTGVAVSMYAPPERTAAAQGLLGGLQVLVGGVSSLAAGVMYETFGRAPSYLACATVMLGLVALGAWLAGPEWGRRPEPESSLREDSLSDPALVPSP